MDKQETIKGLTPYLAPMLSLALLPFVSNFAIVAPSPESIDDPGCVTCTATQTYSEIEPVSALALAELGEGKAVLFLPNASSSSLAAYRMILAVYKKHGLGSFVVAVPQETSTAVTMALQCKTDGVPLVQLKTQESTQALPTIVVDDGKGPVAHTPLGPYFATSYYDHEKKN